MTKFLHLKFPAILLVLLAAYNQCQAQCPPLTPSNPNFGLSVSYDSDDGVLRQFTTATYSNCDGENSLVNFGNSGSRTRVCNFNQVTLQPFWTGEEPTCRVLLCADGVLEGLFPNLTINYTTPLLPALHEGDPPAGGYRGGTRADYTCPPTYGVSGQSFDLCQQNLESGVLVSVDWDIGSRTCERQCPILDNNGTRLNFRGLSGGISYDPVSRVPGTIARYQCLNSVAFIPNGTLERECIANASINPDTPFWTEPEPNCIPICQDQPPLENGVITYDPDEEFRFIGTVATYTCNEGFTYVGVNTSSICTTRVVQLGGGQFVVFNVFDPPATICIPIECPALPEIANGVISYSPDTTPDYSLSTVATYTCNFGYVLRGDNEMRTCVNAGDGSARFNGQEPTCERQCPELAPIPNGAISYDPDMTPDFDVGTVANHTCDDNFILVLGSEIRTCLDTGRWSGFTPVCRPVECLPLPFIPNGVITYDPDMIADFDVGTLATHRCNGGFRLVGPRIRTCLGSMTWSDEPPVCEPVGCPPLAPLPNGVITYGPDVTPDYDVDTVATHTCNEGFEFTPGVGDQTRVCLASGRWSGLIPVCEPLCPALQPIPNGVLTYGPTFTPSSAAYFSRGTLALYTCNAGFMLVGSESQLCLVGGRWSSQPPECQPIQCPPLPMFPNGMITYSSGPSPINYPVGTEAVYECNAPEGYCLPAGATLRVCELPSGTWSGVEPETCGRISCELLSIINGVVSYSDGSLIQDGTTANQTCQEGFVLTGSRIRTCIAMYQTPVICEEFMGNWTGQAGMCVGNFVIVNDTAIGDPLMTVPLNIADKTSFFEASINNNIGPNDIINLCYELHGRRDAFVNLVSDECISVNAHYELVQPNEPREDINIIDNIHVRATDSIGRCRNIGVALNEGGVCTASVDEANIADMYQANGISIRRYTNRVRIMVPNCEDVNLVMWVFCRQSTFWSTFRTDNNGAELTFQADMIKFVIARGFNLRESSHGIIGQFWNIPILVEPFTGSIRSSASTDNLYQVTIQHPNERREFTAWLYRLTWEYRQEYCLYAGNQQAGSVYEVVSPNDPVIEGTYADYIVDTAYGTDFAFTHFNERRCNSVVTGSGESVTLN